MPCDQPVCLTCFLKQSCFVWNERIAKRRLCESKKSRVESEAGNKIERHGISGARLAAVDGTFFQCVRQDVAFPKRKDVFLDLKSTGNHQIKRSSTGSFWLLLSMHQKARSALFERSQR